MNKPPAVQWLIFAAPLIFVLLWSTGYLSGRILRPYVDPLTFSAVRFGIAGLILALIAFVRGATWPNDLATWLHLAICGVLIQGIFITGMMAAINIGLEMGTAALVGGMQPIVTALIASIWLKERFSGQQKFGFVLGFAGLLMVLWQGATGSGFSLTGLVVGLSAMLGITIGTLYQKRFISDVDLLSGTAIQFVAAFLPIFALAYFFEEGRIEWNITVLLTTVWLITAQSIGAILILFYLIRSGAVARVSSLFYLVPPVCAIQGFYFFEENLDWIQIVGIAIVVLSVIMITRLPKAG